MVVFSVNELKFIKDNEICRIATSKNDIPHVVPVCYIYKNNNIIFATDYNTKKYNNLIINNRISVIVDVFNKKNGNKGIYITGIAFTLEKGKEYRELYELFYDKFDWVKRDPWKEGEAPFIKIQIIKKVSWGLENKH